MFQSICGLQSCAKNRHSIMLKGSKIKQSFKTPLVNKIQLSRSLSLVRKIDEIEFDDYDKAFMLRRLSNYCYYQTIIAEFEPREQEQENYSPYQHENFNKEDRKHSLWHAVFNNDKRYFTPAFVMGRDLRDYKEYPSYDLEKFKEKVLDARKKIEEEGKKKSEILCPKPSSFKCQICRCQYQEYLQHIKQQNHIKLYRQSKGWEYINEFIQDFQRNKKEKAPENSKTRKKQKIERVYQGRRQKQSFKTKLITKKIPANLKIFGIKNKFTGISSTYLTVGRDSIN